MSWRPESYDPSLLEDPEWQAALRAAESPQRPRPRNVRESPSERAGPAQDLRSFYNNGALHDDDQAVEPPRNIRAPAGSGSFQAPVTISDDEDDSTSHTSVRTLPSSQTSSLPLNSSRTMPHNPSSTSHSRQNFSTGPRQTSTQLTQRPYTQISLLDSPPPVSRHSSSLSQSTPALTPVSSQASHHDTDLALAMQLQREFDSESVELDLDICPSLPPFSLSQSTGLPRQRSSQERHIPQISDRRGETRARPAGPQRGAAGAFQSRSPGISNTNQHNRNQGGRNNTATLPPLNRGASAPVGPAHSPVASRVVDLRPGAHIEFTVGQHPPQPTARTQAGRIATRSQGRPARQVDLGRQPVRRAPRNNPGAAGFRGRRRAVDDEDDEDDVDDDEDDDDDDEEDFMAHSSDDDFLAPEDDEDEMRLRTGVSMAARSPAPRLADVDFYAIVNGRPRDGPGSRRNLMAEDVELAFALQEAEYHDAREVSQVRAAERRFQRSVRGRGRGRLGAFEVDVNDYDAMLRLSESAPPVKRGVSAGVLNRLPVVQSSHDDCTICQGTADSAMVALPCMHAFHKECIMPHLKSSRFCPNCRHEIE